MQINVKLFFCYFTIACIHVVTGYDVFIERCSQRSIHSVDWLRRQHHRVCASLCMVIIYYIIILFHFQSEL